MGGTTDPTPTALPPNFNKYLMSAYYVAGVTLGDQDMDPGGESWERGKLHVCGSSVYTVENGQGKTTQLRPEG